MTLISKRKLARTRKKIGLLNKLSYYEKLDSKLLNVKTFAFAYFSTCDPDAALKEFKDLVTDELAYLSASQIVTNTRCGNAHISSSEKQFNFSSIITTNTSKLVGQTSSKIEGRIRSLNINKKYIKTQRERGFLFSFLKIVKGETNIEKAMIDSIKNAVIFNGKSHESTELYLSFLYNMIAIDSLLSSRSENHKVKISKAVEHFIGWSNMLDTSYEKEIDNIYNLRADLVHDGKRDKIKVKNLLFTDDILRNILFNICNHPTIFASKNDLKEFLKKLDAEKTLGIKSKNLPKTFRVFKKYYTKSDNENH